MENLSLMLFISFAAPLIMAIIICKDKSQLLLSFLFIGTVVGLFCGELNGILVNILPIDNVEYTSNISPLLEECFKSIPILLYAFNFKPKKQTLLECAALVGVGFAVLENAFILAENAMSMSIPIAVIRGFGAGLMHGVCTMCVGYGISFVHTRRKVFYTGTIAILAAVSIYHSIYNMLVQSEHEILGFILPTLTFIPIWFVFCKNKKDS